MRLVSPAPSIEEARSDLLEDGSATPLPAAEFGAVGGLKVRGKGRIPPSVGSGVVEELRRVYEERCRIVRSQEPGVRVGGERGGGVSRGVRGVGIGRVR